MCFARSVGVNPPGSHLFLSAAGPERASGSRGRGRCDGDLGICHICPKR